jgi:type I site-specific restriction-modification system R (restriction) subunit
MVRLRSFPWLSSTIQKFPYICSETKVKFAVIIDETHSSQSGKVNAKMKMALQGHGECPRRIDAFSLPPA